MARLAVTGAGGFVGRQVVSLARAEGWDVAGPGRGGQGAPAGAPARPCPRAEPRTMARLAVTGAGGFVGRQVVSLARAEGWDVAGLVRSDEAARVVSQAGGAAVPIAGLTADALRPALSGAAA